MISPRVSTEVPTMNFWVIQNWGKSRIIRARSTIFNKRGFIVYTLGLVKTLQSPAVIKD